MSSKRSPHDPAYKQFFSNQEMVESLLKDFVDEDFIKDLNFSTLERCRGSYVTDDLRERHDDIIWRVRWRGTWCYLYLLLEFQSTPDPWMAVRILCYTALLYQDLIRNNALPENGCLPPVFPIVIYNGKKPWTAVKDVAHLLHASSSRLEAYQPRQRYFLLDEGRIATERLSERDSLSALLLRLERAESVMDLRLLVGQLREKLHEPRYTHLRRVFAVWLGRIIIRRAGITQDIPEFQDLQEVDAMLEERVAEWYEQWKQEALALGRLEGETIGKAQGEAIGRAQGEAIGEIKAMRTLISDLLSDKFGMISLPLMEKINELQTASELRLLILSVYKAETLEQVNAAAEELLKKE